jgi:O-antigen/teichoic acid export membrane protein
VRSQVEIDKRLVLRGSASALVARLIDIGLLLWFNQYLIRRIGPEEYSLYPLIMSIMGFLMIAKGALDASNSRYVIAAYARGNLDLVTSTSSTLFVYAAIVVSLIVCAAVPFIYWIDRVLVVTPSLANDLRIMAALITIGLAVMMLSSPFEVALRAKQRFVTINAVEVGTEMLRLVLLAVLVFGISTRVLWVVVATEGARLLGALMRLRLSLRLIPELRFRLSAVDFTHGKRLLSFGGWGFIGGTMNRIKTSVDPLILNQLATPLDVTAFHIGSLFSRHIARVRIMATDALSPSLVAMHATGQTERLQNAFMKFGRIMIWSYMLLAVPLMVYAPDFTRLYVGERYLMAAPVMIILLANEIPYLGVSMVSKLAAAKAQVRPTALRSVVAQVCNVGITIYLVGALQMGAMGSAVGTLIGNAGIRCALIIPLALKLAELDTRTWVTRTILPGLPPIVAGLTVWLTLKVVAPPTTWFTLLAYGAAGAVAYLLALVSLSLQPDDQKDVKRLISAIALRRQHT